MSKDDLLKVYSAPLIPDKFPHVINQIQRPRIFLVNFLFKNNAFLILRFLEYILFIRFLTFSVDILITVLYISAIRACSSCDFLGLFDPDKDPPNEDLLRPLPIDLLLLLPKIGVSSLPSSSSSSSRIGTPRKPLPVLNLFFPLLISKGIKVL